VRVLLGFLIAPLAPGLLLEAARLLPAFRSAAGLTVIGYSYPVSWIVGIPAFVIYEYLLSWRRLWQYALGGFLFLQALAWSFLLLAGEFLEPDFTLAGAAGYAAMMGVLGAATTIVFWMIVVWPSTRAK
jgi:hypothetical protein